MSLSKTNYQLNILIEYTISLVKYSDVGEFIDIKL